MKKIAILISGSGSNAEAIIKACNSNIISGEVMIVISNNPNAYGLIRATKLGIKTKIIKAISAKSSKNLNYELNKYKFVTDGIIIDSPKDNLPGGNGKTFNWKFLKKRKKKVNWLLAGGINLSNVSRAIKITKTKGLDISSGVEISKGIKSPRLISSFVKKCRNI